MPNIEAGKEYVDRKGEVNVVVCTDKPGDYPVIGYRRRDGRVRGWAPGGRFLRDGTEHSSDLIREHREPVRVVVEREAYRGMSGDAWVAFYHSDLTPGTRYRVTVEEIVEGEK